MRHFLQLVALTAVSALGLAADTDRGVELYRQAKYSEAQSELSKSVEANPDDARARLFLGLALVEQHKPEEAEPHLKKADELNSSSDTKLGLARLHLERKELDKAEALINECEGPEKDYVRGLLHFHRHQNREAASALETYLEKYPDHAYAHYYAGLAYNAMKRPEKMMSHFETFLRLTPNAPEARKVRAVLSTGR